MSKETALFKINYWVQRKRKKTWSVLKEEIGKEKKFQQSYPKKMFSEKKEITDIKSIAENFNICFIAIRLTLA